MLFLGRGQRAPQIAARVALRPSSRHGIAEYLPAVLMHPVRRVERATGFNPAKHGQDFWGCNLAYWPLAQPGEGALLKPGNDLIGMGGRSRGLILGEPLAGDDFKGIRFRRLCRLHGLALCAGAMPWANSLRASSRLSRASFKPVPGNPPNASRFSFPSKRYLSRKYLEPVGMTSSYMPFSSDSL